MELGKLIWCANIISLQTHIMNLNVLLPELSDESLLHCWPELKPKCLAKEKQVFHQTWWPMGQITVKLSCQEEERQINKKQGHRMAVETHWRIFYFQNLLEILKMICSFPLWNYLCLLILKVCKLKSKLILFQMKVLNLYPSWLFYEVLYLYCLP